MIVPMPEKKIVVVTGKPVSTGTSAVAPNIARMCWPPRPSMFGMSSRSFGLTTAPGCDGPPVTVELPHPVDSRTHISPSLRNALPWA